MPLCDVAAPPDYDNGCRKAAPHLTVASRRRKAPYQLVIRAPPIYAELQELGIDVSGSTVPRCRPRQPRQPQDLPCRCSPTRPVDPSFFNVRRASATARAGSVRCLRISQRTNVPVKPSAKVRSWASSLRSTPCPARTPSTYSASGKNGRRPPPFEHVGRWSGAPVVPDASSGGLAIRVSKEAGCASWSGWDADRGAHRHRWLPLATPAATRPPGRRAQPVGPRIRNPVNHAAPLTLPRPSGEVSGFSSVESTPLREGHRLSTHVGSRRGLTMQRLPHPGRPSRDNE